MGDMGAHTFDAPIWALDLGMPTKIQATTTPFNENYLPQSESVTYHFEGRNGKPPVNVTWSDGGIKPARPQQLEANRGLREALYIGDKGMMMHGTQGASPELIPNNPDFAPKKELPRPSNIYVDFVEAIKEKRQAANNFEIAAKVTEVMLLTNIAVAAQRLDITLDYDAENMRITNCEEANNYFHYDYRKGWSL
jgi:predicted dehydrogenase